MIAPPELQFDPIGHIYEFEGQRVPSVTQVLKEMGLTDYSMIPQEVLSAAAARGTAVHRLTQFYDEYDLDESTVTPELQPYFDAYKRFREESGFKVLYNEARGYDPALRVAGTLDRTGILGGLLCVLDIKSGILLPGHALQVTAYAQFLAEPMRYRRFALQLKDDASYVLTEFPITSRASDLQAWQSAALLWHWRNNHKLIRKDEFDYAYV